MEILDNKIKHFNFSQNFKRDPYSIQIKVEFQIHNLNRMKVQCPKN